MPCKSINLPDFVIIGANKAGTTSVANYLNEHPKIQMAEVKEPMFFSSSAGVASADRNSATLEKPFYAVTLEEYSNMFATKKPEANVFGEASTAYLANPTKSAQLMKKIVPDTRVIAILREPTDRAISAYKMCFGDAIEDRSFTEIVDNAENERRVLVGHGVREYIRNGLYAQLLKPYFEYFSREQILLLNYEELKCAPNAFMHKIYQFLELQPVKNNFEIKYNTEFDHLKEPLNIAQADIARLRDIYKEENENLKRLFKFTFELDTGLLSDH